MSLGNTIRRWVMGRSYWFERLFASQDFSISGQPGVVLAEMGVPEAYEFDFYRRFTEHVFEHTMPPMVRRLVLRDRGTALIDPDRPLAREAFKPSTLVDYLGSQHTPEGDLYIERPVAWRPPGMRRNPRDHGHFLWRESGPSGTPDILEKVGARIAGYYFGRLLPQKRVPWRHQVRRIYDQAVEQLAALYPSLPCRQVHYSDPNSVRAGIDDLVEMGCRTILFQSYCSPIYSDFEEYAYACPMAEQLVAGRAKMIFGDQLGVQPALCRAYASLIGDALRGIDPAASVMLVLSRHGHPFSRETYDLRADEYVRPLTTICQRLLDQRSGQGQITVSFDEYADEYWDPKGRKLSTSDAFRRAIDAGFDCVIEAPIEFVAENTDTMILHAMHKFAGFSAYDPSAPICYPDWEKPLQREFQEGRTRVISLGSPVGTHSTHVAQAVVDSIAGLLGD